MSPKSHAALDLLTFGGWEIIGTPVEGFQGKTETITIEYDKNNKFVSVNTVEGHIKKEETNKTEEAKKEEEIKTTSFKPQTNFIPNRKEQK